MSKLGYYLKVAAVAVIGILAALLGIESMRLKKAQTQIALTDAEDKVKGLRDKIDNHREDANNAELELRRAEAEYNHHVRVNNSLTDATKPKS